MSESFGQATTPVNVLRGILQRYPHSFGQLLEIKQNSEDAGASKQIFALDRRRHPTGSLYHTQLVSTQGPSLLAYNDAEFVDNDWHALQNTYESSKAEDSSKIGKFGVGFRSLFHITDCPQIVSGSTMAIFDPLSIFTGSHGIKTDLSLISSHYPDQLQPFQFLMQPVNEVFKGTIIRCPLRTVASKISSRIIHPEEIVSQFFHKFINEELRTSLLFLRNLQHVEFSEINEQGTSECMATLSISRSPAICRPDGSNTHILTAEIKKGSRAQGRVEKWFILHCPFSKVEAIQLISKTFPGDPTEILKSHKLSPHVGIAVALDPLSTEKTSGQLFTYLPLPIPTGFPVHIHALFSIEDSRQHLANSQTKGLVPGSDHHFVVVWNQLLFDHYIPQAWKLFLEILVEQGNITDIFDMWPPRQGSPTSGESVYWKFLPQRVFAAATSSASSIWPLYRQQNSPTSNIEYKSLDLLISAEPNTPRPLLDALTAMGLQLTCPPDYIYDLIKDFGGFRFLCPEVAHESLLGHKDGLSKAPEADRNIVIEFLLSNGDVNDIVDLAIIPIVGGGCVALSAKATSPGVKAHIMLNKVESDIFGACDNNAINLRSLPSQAAKTLITEGPKFLNVEQLSISHIVEYLTTYPNKLGLDLSLVRNDLRAIKWLSAFWFWFSTYSQKEDLFTKIRHLYLLPSTQGLRKAETPLFKSLGEHPNSVQHLSSIGVPFLDADLSSSAQDVIESRQLLKRISNIHALLDSFSLPSTDGKPLSANACTTVLRHVTMCAPGSRNQNGPFTPEQIKNLKSIPIFPMATFSPNHTGLLIEWTSIPENLSLKSIENPSFLPIIPGLGFIQLNRVTAGILEYLEPPTSNSFLSDIDVLSLTVDNFTSQSDYVQAAALRYLVQHRRFVPPIVLEKLRGMQFVEVMDGSKQKPTDVVDPKSKLVALYEDTPWAQVHADTTSKQEIVRLLHNLGMMRQVLTTPIVQERIDFISQASSPKAIDISRTLLSLIVSSRFDCSGLEVTPKQKWLPTNRGLCGYTECRDETITRPSLFDQVLATMESYKIPSSLTHVLGWTEPVSREILIKQLGGVLGNGGDNFSKVHDIIKELSVRSCNATDFVELRKVTAGKKWVPTADGQLAETQNAVFLAPIPESGFHRVLSLDNKMRGFLERMGCQERPTTDAVIANLKALQGQPPSLDSVNISLNLLRSLPTEPDDAERARLLVPDSAYQLRPLAEVYFNDIGSHSSLVSSGDDHTAHDLLDESLARKLGLGRLGLKYVDFSNTYADMGQDLVTTVRNNLEQYKDKQFATEFLANAVDANATQFTLLVNRFYPPQDGNIRALSAEMVPFCCSPSLVVYNNATFTDADFVGIRRTGIGGKEGQGNTIGQFGLGALTMFHFTEMAILISNSNVLFLNPSKEHLPIRDQASLMLPLKRVREYYPSHIACVDGLFGFSVSSDGPFNGTIFILPLRDGRHLQGHESRAISQRTYTVEDIYHILEDFKHSAIDGCSASDCFLFTKIECISELHRSSSGVTEAVWSVSATRTPEEIELGTKFSSNDVTIINGAGVSSTWKTVKASVLKKDIPQDIVAPILTTSRPRFPALAGLAVLFPSGETAHNSQSHRFFSTLPLSLQTSLPIHVMASFLLSPDRRSIRLDVFESKFNTWLLSSVIPPLYLFLLEKLLEQGDNKYWWPRHSRTHTEDPYSRLIAEAFYSDHLKISNRRVLYSTYDTGNVLTPQEAVIAGEEPSCIERVLSIVESRLVAKPLKGVFQLMKKSDFPVVSPEFVKSEILTVASSGILSQVAFKDIEDTMVYLLGNKMEVAPNLHNLPILPLENGGLGTIQNRSNDDMSKFYVWIPHKPNKHHNFPQQYFVHPNLKKKLKETLLKIDVNVIALNIEVVRSFIIMKFPLPFSFPFEASAELSLWIDEFWDLWEEYARLGLLPDHISELPLVPTVRPNCYVSLLSCKNVSSLLVGESTEQFEHIRVLLDNLGINVVRVSSDSIPASLLRILQADDFPPFNLENVLRALGPRSRDIAEIIQHFDDDLQAAFASWARSNIRQLLHPELQLIAQQLPLWTAACAGFTESLHAAASIRMLPKDLPLAITAPFMNTLVAEYGNLRFLDGPQLQYEQLQDMLILPDILSLPALQSYRQFLEVWLRGLPPSYTTAVPIPNCNMAVQLSSSLYARDPLFEIVFGPNSPLFIHPELQQLESTLYKHGLKTENHLDVAMFIECAEALHLIDEDEDMDDKLARATVLFDAYGTSLSINTVAKENVQYLFHELDDYAFIPRDMATRRLLPDQDHRFPGLDFPPNVVALPRIVTPPDLVRKEFESIAWTQRASFAEQPNPRAIMVYPGLGRPTVSEVIAHIQALSQLKDLSPSQSLIILHDVEESYRFLNDEAVTASFAISSLENKNLFLNVDSPQSEEWRWDNAEQLVFERHDIDADIRHVRRLLLPFEKLLRASGAIQVYHPQYPTSPNLGDSDLTLQRLRSGFQDLRESGVFTDVVFSANDKDINTKPLVGHRVFLAVCSEYFRDRFCGGFQEARPASTENPVECEVVDHSTDCVCSVLDYIYTGHQPEVEDLSIELVLDILQLSSYWCLMDLFEDIQREIASKLLKPQLIEQIKAAAEIARAEKLLQTCVEYEENNEALMRRQCELRSMQ